jgi:CubicO group peptidase (beta-lactamase class C family)
VESGKLDLDKPVSSYLTRWALPQSDFNNDDVTIRRLLSHTAGITDGLGHNGFDTRTEIQPLTEHLTQAKDADEGVDGRVHVGIKPGSQFKYSGGSYNLLQLIVEEVTGMSFEFYMSEAVFNPLGMASTTYSQEDVKQLAEYFEDENNTRSYPFYTSLAATGLYSSANDLAKLVSMQLPEDLKNSESKNLLSKESLKEMRMPHASTMGLDIWGLGTMLFASNNEYDYIIGHGGQSPSLNSTVRLNPANGNAIILLETGNRALAADSATKWTLWETGNPDMYMLKNMIPAMLKRVLIGCVLIFVASLIIVWRKKKKKQN